MPLRPHEADQLAGPQPEGILGWLDQHPRQRGRQVSAGVGLVAVLIHANGGWQSGVAPHPTPSVGLVGQCSYPSASVAQTRRLASQRHALLALVRHPHACARTAVGSSRSTARATRSAAAAIAGGRAWPRRWDGAPTTWVRSTTRGLRQPIGGIPHREMTRRVGGHVDPAWFDRERCDRQVRVALRPNRRIRLYQPASRRQHRPRS